MSKTNEEIKSQIKQKEKELIGLIRESGKDERSKSIAVTNIEQGVMWGVRSLFS